MKVFTHRLLSLLIALTILICNSGRVHSQGCSSTAGATFMGTLTPSTTYQSITTANAGEYWNFTGTICNKYEFSFCPADGGTAAWNTQLTIDDNTGAANTGGYNDDYCGNKSYVSWTPTSTGTYRIFITRYSCQLTSATSGTLMYRVTPLSTIISEYSLVGNATAPSGCAALTADATNQKGCAWDVNSTLDFSSSFSYDFTINLGNDDAGADGLAFVMQNDPSGLCVCGSTGGGMGAQGITNSVIIEIDTYLNYEDRDDGITGVLCSGGPDPDHIDLWLNGNVNPTGTCGGTPGARIIPAAIPLLQGASYYNIENGLDHTLRISWVPSGASGTLTASVMDANAITTYATLSYTFTPLTVFGTQTPYYGFTASTGALTNEQSACIATVLLPVELISWNATCINNGSVQLDWQTASEVHNSFFSIERSGDGNDFESIVNITGAGTSSEPHHYSFTDAHPVPGTGYYRLTEVADNGDRKYSNLVSAACEKSSQSSFQAYADENGNVILSFNGLEISESEIRVIDMNGKVFLNLHPGKQQAETNSSLKFHSGNLPAGIYLVTLRNHSQYYCTKLFIF